MIKLINVLNLWNIWNDYFKGAKKLINDFKIFNPLQNALDTAYFNTIPQTKLINIV